MDRQPDDETGKGVQIPAGGQNHSVQALRGVLHHEEGAGPDSDSRERKSKKMQRGLVEVYRGRRVFTTLRVREISCSP